MPIFSSSKSSTDVFAHTEKSPVTASGEASVASRGSIVFSTPTTTVDNTGATQFKVKGKGQIIINQNSDKDLLGQILASQGAASAASDARLGDLLGRITDLAENKQTGGESGRDKTILYVVLGVGAVLAMIFGKGRWGLYLAIGAVGYFLFGGKKEEEPKA